MNYKIVIPTLLCGVLFCLGGCIQPIRNTGAITHEPTATTNPADFADMTVQDWVDISPDQMWTATGMVATPQNGGEQYYTELRVTNADGTITWTPVAGWSNFGLGYTTPRIVHWSADGRYLYFTNAPHPDGCGFFVNASDLHQLDLTTGAVAEILPANSAWVLAAAPDGTIAYLQDDALKLLDPTTANTVRIALDMVETNVQIGNLVWSPDSQQVAYVVATDLCLPTTWRHAIYTVDRQGEDLRLVLPADERRFRIVDWIDTSHLLLMDLDSHSWVLDLASGEVEAANVSSLCRPGATILCSVAPDGAQVAVVNPTQGSLVLQRSAGPAQEFFSPGDGISTTLWSPDSRYLLVVRNNWAQPAGSATLVAGGPPELWQIDLTTIPNITPTRVFGPAQLPSEPAMFTPGQVVFGDWSPDGQRLLFWVGPLGASILADGLPLYALELRTGATMLLASTALLNPAYHSWAPDGTALVYTAGGYRSAQIDKWLNHWDVTTGQITTLISKTEQIPGIVAWSPQGDQIAYAAVATELTGPEWADEQSFANQAIAGRRIYLLTPATGEMRRLNQDEAYQDAPVWSDTGDQLYYVQRAGEEMVLMVADPASGEAQPVAGARQPLPESPGYYGQGEWADLLAQRPD